MSLTDKTYYVGTKNLPKDDYSSYSDILSELEPEVLKYLMGNILYSLYKANEDAEPYLTLRNGGNYVVDKNGVEVTLVYPGLKELVGHYSYCEIMRNRVTSTQSVGEVRSRVENSGYANNFRKVFSAWARFEELYGYPGQSKLIPSAYNFLNANKELFPDWIFEDLRGGINGHDL